MKTRDRIVWTIRIVGVLTALVAIARTNPSLAIFGLLLVFESWDNSSEIHSLATSIDGRITELLKYEHLTTADHIWDAAKHILLETQADDEILSTASTPNDPEFEREVFQRVAHHGLVYKRLVCSVDEDDTVSTVGFPPVGDIKGDTNEELLDSYLTWYRIFYAAWDSVLTNDESGRGESLGMRTWYQALTKLMVPFKRFEVLSHASEIASDYFILEPHRDRPAQAVVGFPKNKGEGMRGGLRITNSVLAKDLRQNWQRLWNRALHKAARRH